MALAAIAVGCSGQAFQTGNSCEGGECPPPVITTAGSGGLAAAGSPSAGGTLAGSAGAAAGAGVGAVGGSVASGAAAGAEAGGGGGAGAVAAGGAAGVAGEPPISTAGSGGDAVGAAGTCSLDSCPPQAATGVELSRRDWRVSASNTYFPNTKAEYVIDDDPDTCWASGVGQVADMWFLLDMQKPQFFFEIDVSTLASSSDYARRLRVSVSTDGERFTTLRQDIAGMQELKIAFKEAQFARYLKLELMKDSGGLWWRIDDLRVRR